MVSYNNSERIKALEAKVALLESRQEGVAAAEAEPTYPIGKVVSVRGKVQRERTLYYERAYSDVVVVTGILSEVNRRDNKRPVVVIGRAKDGIDTGITVVEAEFL